MAPRATAMLLGSGLGAFASRNQIQPHSFSPVDGVDGHPRGNVTVESHELRHRSLAHRSGGHEVWLGPGSFVESSADSISKLSPGDDDAESPFTWEARFHMTCLFIGVLFSDMFLTNRLLPFLDLTHILEVILTSFSPKAWVMGAKAKIDDLTKEKADELAKIFKGKEEDPDQQAGMLEEVGGDMQRLKTVVAKVASPFSKEEWRKALEEDELNKIFQGKNVDPKNYLHLHALAKGDMQRLKAAVAKVGTPFSEEKLKEALKEETMWEKIKVVIGFFTTQEALKELWKPAVRFFSMWAHDLAPVKAADQELLKMADLDADLMKYVKVVAKTMPDAPALTADELKKQEEEFKQYSQTAKDFLPMLSPYETGIWKEFLKTFESHVAENGKDKAAKEEGTLLGEYGLEQEGFWKSRNKLIEKNLYFFKMQSMYVQEGKRIEAANNKKGGGGGGAAGGGAAGGGAAGGGTEGA